MRINDITEDIAQFPDRKDEVFRDKIKDLADGFPKAMADHNRQLAQSQEMLSKFKERAATNTKKFASPTIMSGYIKSVRTLEALSYAIHGDGGDPKQVVDFAQKLALENLPEIVAAYKKDINDARAKMDEIRAWPQSTPGLMRYLLDGWFYFVHALEGELYSYSQLAGKHGIKLNPYETK